MHEGFDIWVFLTGLPLGLAIASVVMFWNWKKGKKERRFDERYTKIHQQARSISWMVTTVVILIAWTIIIIFEGAGLAFFVFTGVWVLHMISYLIGGFIANSRN